MTQAIFSLKDFRFDKVTMDFTRVHDRELRLEIIPYGTFFEELGRFELNFDFVASDRSSENTDSVIIAVHCVANFIFADIKSIEGIPQYFYANSIAIVFPYIRAFISNITMQANILPLVLPTMNLSNLQYELKSRVVVK